MISVLITAHRSAKPDVSPGDVVRSLSALVPAVVEGLARDVWLLAPDASPDMKHVVDHAGCGLIEAADFASAVAAGTRQCRSAEILFVEAGVMLDRTFLDELTNLLPGIGMAEGKSRYALKRSESDFVGRLFPSQARTVGLLIDRPGLAGVKAETFEALIRAARPTHVFKARAWTGG